MAEIMDSALLEKIRIIKTLILDVDGVFDGWPNYHG